MNGRVELTTYDVEWRAGPDRPWQWCGQGAAPDDLRTMFGARAAPLMAGKTITLDDGREFRVAP